jgi:gamma-glutamylcyclotransferase (GGCT)/AIG2-like uncharacterized protein YtfP
MSGLVYFFYGSLRNGFYNYSRFKIGENAVFLGVAKIKNANLYAYCAHYPKVTNGNGEVVGELYRFHDDKVEQSIRRMEEAAGYCFEIVDAIKESGEIVKALCCFATDKQDQKKLISNGDWLKYKGSEMK